MSVIAKIDRILETVCDEVAKDVYEALSESNVKIKLISSSEIKFSVIVDDNDVDIALNSIHNKIVR